MRYVFIPGAGGMAWYWHRVIPLLRQDGHDAIAVDLPGDDPAAGLPEYAQLVLAEVTGHDDVVLVAQSLGGFTAPMVAARAAVSALVLVNAMIPSPGERAADWGDDTGSAEARIAAAERGGYPTEFDEQLYFMHDVPDDVVAQGADHYRAEVDTAFVTPSAFEAWPATATYVVAGAEDRLFPADFQRRVARDRLGIEADILPGGHLMALSQPAALAEYLLAITA